MTIRLLVQHYGRKWIRSPLILMLVAGFWAISNYLFVLLMLSIGMDGFMPVMFDHMTNLMLVVVPILVLKLSAEDWRDGMDEWLLVRPIAPFQIVVAQWSSIWILALGVVGLTGVDVAVLAYYCNPEWGAIIVGYVGVALFAGFLTAVGVLISVWSRSLMMSAGGTFILGLMALSIGWLADLPVIQHFEWVRLFMVGHVLTQMQEGVVTFSGFFLFLILIAGFIVLAIGVVSRWKSQLFFYVGCGTLVLVIVAVNLPGKLEIGETNWTALSASTKQWVASQKQEILITAWVYSDSYEHRYLSRIIDRYHAVNPLIQGRFLDPDRHPELAARYRIDGPGSLVFESKNQVRQAHTSEIFQYDAQRQLEVLNAEPVINREIQSLVGTERAQVVVLSGRGERRISGGKGSDLDQWIAALSSQHIHVSELNLAMTTVIPPSTRLVVIPGLISAYSQPELKPLQRYNQKGGAMLILTDPAPVWRRLDPMVQLTVSPNIVVDESRAYFYDLTAVIPIPVDHPLNVALSEQNGTLVFPVANALWPLQATPKDWTPLLISSAHAWLAKQVNQDVQRQYANREDGIFVLGAIRSMPGRGPIAIVGDSDWITNRYIGSHDNLSYSIRLVSHLIGQAQPVIGKMRTRAVRPIAILPGQDWVLFGILVIFFPMGLAGVGIWQWYRNRFG